MSEQLKRNKIMTCEVKEISPRVLEFVGSTEALDRQGDKVRASGWNLKNYMKNPVFQWAHDYSAPPIGRAVKVWVEGKKLMFHIEFADRDTYEFADTIYRLYKGGFLKATSVGFIPLDWEGKSGEDDVPKWEGNIFTKQELLELSGCPVPANPEALATAKSKRVINAREYKQMKSLWEDIQNAEIVDTTLEQPEEKPEEEEHKVKEISQEAIADEIDYLFSMIDKVGVSDENARALYDRIKTVIDAFPVADVETPKTEERIAGSDIPVDIPAWEAKVKGYIKEAMEALQAEAKSQTKPTTDEVAEAVKDAIREIARINMEEI